MSSTSPCHDVENPPLNVIDATTGEGREDSTGSPPVVESKQILPVVQHNTEMTATSSLPCGSALPQSGKNASLTVFARHKIQPGKERLFEAWIRDITKLQNDKYPGFEGAQVVRPTCCESSNEYLSIFRYENYDLLQAFMNSEDRRRFLEQTHEFRAAPIDYTYHSLEFLFVHDTETSTIDGSIMDKESSSVPNRPPPRYKMVLVTFLLIWLQSHFFGRTLKNVVPEIPQLALEALTIFLIVLGTTYLWMPIVTKHILHWWLFPR